MLGPFALAGTRLSPHDEASFGSKRGERQGVKRGEKAISGRKGPRQSRGCEDTRRGSRWWTHRKGAVEMSLSEPALAAVANAAGAGGQGEKGTWPLGLRGTKASTGTLDERPYDRYQWSKESSPPTGVHQVNGQEADLLCCSPSTPKENRGRVRGLG